MIRFESQSVGDLADRHDRFLGKDLGQRALALRIEVLDQHKGHACIGRQGPEESGEGFQAAGGGADPHDR